MTDPNYTALLLIIDRSGSMMSIRDDMVRGMSAMLEDQAAQSGMLTVDVVTFDTEIELLHSMADPGAVTIDIDPRGGTALHDAIGIGVQNFGSALAALPEHARPATVQVVVVTDGQENSSREWNPAAVRSLVRHQIDIYKWDFVFLGANQDAVLEGAALGFEADSSMTFAAAPDEVVAMSQTVARYLTDVRRDARTGFSESERRGAEHGR